MNTLSVKLSIVYFKLEDIMLLGLALDYFRFIQLNSL